jgi:hypothetical protein
MSERSNGRLPCSASFVMYTDAETHIAMYTDAETHIAAATFTSQGASESNVAITDSAQCQICRSGKPLELGSLQMQSVGC